MIGLPFVWRDVQSQAGTALTMMMAQASNLSTMVGSAGAHKFRKTRPRQIAITRARLRLILARSVCSRESALDSKDPNQPKSVSYNLLTAARDAFVMLMNNDYIASGLLAL